MANLQRLNQHNHNTADETPRERRRGREQALCARVAYRVAQQKVDRHIAGTCEHSDTRKMVALKG